MIQARDYILHHAAQLIQPQIPGSFRRGTNAQKGDIGILQRFRGRNAGRKAPGIDRIANDVFKPGLVERRYAILDIFDLVGVGIDSNDRMIDMGKAGSGNATHISETEYSNPGRVVSFLHALFYRR